MVQKKLPTINSAHGSETRNIINEIIKAINDRGLEILSESGFLTWLEKNGIKHREEVETFSDLPANDSLNTVRGVTEDNKIYIKKENGWVPFQTIDINKINKVEEYAINRSDSSSINPLFPPVPLIAAKGDDVTDDYSAIQNLINFAELNEKKIEFPAGRFVTSKPIEIKDRTIIQGAGKDKTVFIKREASTHLGIDCVFYCNLKRDWKLKDFSILGNRKNKAEGNGVTTDGMYLKLANYFEVEDVVVDMCKDAFNAVTVWSGKFKQTIAKRCQNYAYRISGGSTSVVYDTTTSWGCGGGYEIISSLYITLLNPLNDENNSGGRPDDPFLPLGSGGDYLTRRYLFMIMASNVTIISPGAENNYTSYMYCEGSEVIIQNPYIYNLFNYASNSDYWHFIAIRGTPSSNVEIINPEFNEVHNMVTNTNHAAHGFYIENPKTQKITLNKFVPLNDSFKHLRYPKQGIEYQYKSSILRMEDAVNPGFFAQINKGEYEDGSASPGFNSNGNRTIKFSKGESTVPFDQPLKMTFRAPLKIQKDPAILRVKMKGAYSGNDFPQIVIRHSENIYDEGTVVKNFVPSGGGLIDTNEYVELTNKTGLYYFEVYLSFGNVQATFDEFSIQEIL